MLCIAIISPAKIPTSMNVIMQYIITLLKNSIESPFRISIKKYSIENPNSIFLTTNLLVKIPVIGAATIIDIKNTEIK